MPIKKKKRKKAVPQSTTDLLTRIKATKWKLQTRDLWNIAGYADPS